MIETWIAQQLIKGLIRSLLLTEVLELLAAACFPQRNRHDFLLVILVNILTNPVVVYLDFWLHGATIAWRWLWVGGLEVAVWLSEALIYRKCLTGTQNPYLFSLILNAASYLGGVCLQYFL
ncbi:MAG: hypothetical protein SPI20_08450 [Ruminococcus callidus]|nr:hypothetical protein [Ruminococcus sp.]MDD6109780.1 hypothetical protein [Ruminococcus sp.]MDD6945790.1 hypothetical protein [Ruminococcus sp.]MDY6145723.1 hypothetical protein [Ruminococcus callidus]